MIKLYDYFRSSSSYRVRIALYLKGLAFKSEHIDLVAQEQRRYAYQNLNPSAAVPTLVDGDYKLTQSPAILEYLEDAYPDQSLMPDGVKPRAYVRQMSMIVATDMHPLNNLKVWKGYVGNVLGADEAQQMAWYKHWIKEGFDAYESFLRAESKSGAFTYGDEPTLADCYLIPQIYNARRFGFDMRGYKALCAIERNALQLEAFQKASPEAHPNAPAGLEVIHGAGSPILASAA